MWHHTLRTPSLLRAWKGTVIQEAERPPGQRVHTRVLWGMFTGDEPCRDLFWMSLSWGSLRGIWRSWGRDEG